MSDGGDGASVFTWEEGEGAEELVGVEDDGASGDAAVAAGDGVDDGGGVAGGGGDGVDGVSVDGMSSSGSGVVRLHPPFLRPSARRSWDSRLALPVPLLMTVSPSSRTQRSSAARISGSCSSAAFSACCDAAIAIPTTTGGG